MTAAPERPSFAAALRFWLLLGCISFGGPAGQIAIMHAELVDRRRWVDEQEFARALDVCMLLPGPEATQLATWIGWRLHGLRGGVVAGVLFILPASLLLALLSWLYMAGRAYPSVQGVVFGLQAAVLGLLAAALDRLGRRVLKGAFARGLAVAALVAIAAGVPFPAVVLAAALAGLVRSGTGTGPTAPIRAVDGAGDRAPSLARSLATAASLAVAWLAPLAAIGAWLGTDSTLFRLGAFLSKAALVTVGGAYAVLPYVAAHAVDTYAWLSPAQMMSGLALAETTPGPLILVLEYVGFVAGWRQPDLATPLSSALAAAAVALWATFVPSFMFVLTLAPWIERIGRWRRAAAALSGVTAAVVGVIAHLALWFAYNLLAHATPARAVLATAIALAVYVGIARRGWPVPLVVVACGLVGAATGLRV
ncbi:chromate efflux transporter [Cognatilysobacter segetis]|uniref:chromate efflux transporter n=1 Tax=Cognatilysobacter segetis TaxID=2492394 RepID=UPI0010613CB5|nr:chromate efflux transporter [Lysobacter segetis]